MFEQLNNEVQQWASNIVTDVKAAGTADGVTHRANSPSKGASLSRIRSTVSLSQGVASKVSIGFPRSLIYTVKGAGKGIGGRKGSRWTTAKGDSRVTNPKSLNKLGSGNRQPKDFFSQALAGPRGLDTLGDIVATGIGEVMTNNILIK